MGKNITVAEGHYTGVKIDHRNGKETEVEHRVEMMPVIDGYHNAIVKDRSQFGRPFVTLFPDDINDLLVHGDLTFKEWKVLLFLIANLQKDNLVMTNLDIIAENLHIHRTDVSRALTSLKKMNILIEVKMSHTRGSGPVTSIFKVKVVNPNIAYNSQTKDYKTSRSEAPRVTKRDGVKMLNPHAENERQKLLREQEERESLFPGYDQEYGESSPDPESFDPETGEIIDNQGQEERFVGNLQTGEFDIQ